MNPSKPFWKRVLALPLLATAALFATSCAAPEAPPIAEAPLADTAAEPPPAQPVADDSNATDPNAAKPGQTAPDFTLPDTHGKNRSLSDFRGKYVVLEWLNHGCPFVKKQYGSGNMQRLQKEAVQDGVVWLSIVSSRPGTQGHDTAEGHNKTAQEMGAAGTAILLDEEGKVGRLYHAKTTPHMFVISPEGTILYNGAIDDKPTTDKADIPGAKNYVKIALEEAHAGKKISTPVTQPYGCAVKY